MSYLHGCAAPHRASPGEQDAERAWARLNAALGEVAPGCRGLDLFTADRLTPDERDRCEAICTGCVVAGLCREYADAANVRAGFWAGRAYPVKNTDRAVSPGTYR